MDKFIPTDKHIFTEKILRTNDMEVIYSSIATADKSFFVFGGDTNDAFKPSDSVMKYDTVADHWHKMASPMPHYLWAATAQRVGNEIFIMGGGRRSLYTSHNLAYNITNDSWAEKASMPISRKGLVSGVINGIIYIAFGYQMWGKYAVTSYCYAYDPKIDLWKKCQNPDGYKSYAMSVVLDNYLYVLGGYSPTHREGECVNMDRYCPETDSWESMPDMPRPRKNAVAVAIDSKIFILCGSSVENYVTMDYYDTETRTWTVSDIPTPQIHSPVATVIDNKIYLTTGMNNMGGYNKVLYEITYGGIKK